MIGEVEKTLGQQHFLTWFNFQHTEVSQSVGKSTAEAEKFSAFASPILR
jgi:hypothetical protein